jgi:hypothetical protein
VNEVSQDQDIVERARALVGQAEQVRDRARPARSDSEALKEALRRFVPAERRPS